MDSQTRRAYAHFRNARQMPANQALTHARNEVFLREETDGGRLRVRWVPDPDAEPYDDGSYPQDGFWGCVLEKRTGLEEWDHVESLWGIDVRPIDPYCRDVESELAGEARREYVKLSHGVNRQKPEDDNERWPDMETPTGRISCTSLDVGDYNGLGSLGEGNIRAITRDLGDANVYEEHGRYGYRRLWILDTYANREALNKLVDDYPVYDEEAMSQVEIEWEESAFQDWLADGIGRELETEYGAGFREVWDELPMGFRDIDAETETRTEVKYPDDVPDRMSIYRAAMEAENEYPTFDENSASVRVENIIDCVARLMLPTMTDDPGGIATLRAWWAYGSTDDVPASDAMNPEGWKHPSISEPEDWSNSLALRAFADEMIEHDPDNGLGQFIAEAFATAEKHHYTAQHVGWDRFGIGVSK